MISPHFDDAVLSCWSILDKHGPDALVRLSLGQAKRKAAAISRYAGEVPRVDDLGSRLTHPADEFLYEVLWHRIKG